MHLYGLVGHAGDNIFKNQTALQEKQDGTVHQVGTMEY